MSVQASKSLWNPNVSLIKCIFYLKFKACPNTSTILEDKQFLFLEFILVFVSYTLYVNCSQMFCYACKKEWIKRGMFENNFIA